MRIHQLPVEFINNSPSKLSYIERCIKERAIPPKVKKQGKIVTVCKHNTIDAYLTTLQNTLNYKKGA